MEFTIKVPDITVHNVKKVLLVLGMILSFGYMYWINRYDSLNSFLFYAIFPITHMAFFAGLYGLWTKTRRHWILLPTLFAVFWLLYDIYWIFRVFDDIPTMIKAFQNSCVQTLIMWVLSVCGGKLVIKLYNQIGVKEQS